MTRPDQTRDNKNPVGLFCVAAVLFLASVLTFAFPKGWTDENGAPASPTTIRVFSGIQLSFALLLSGDGVSRFTKFKVAGRIVAQIGGLLLIAGVAYFAVVMLAQLFSGLANLASWLVSLF